MQHNYIYVIQKNIAYIIVMQYNNSKVFRRNELRKMNVVEKLDKNLLDKELIRIYGNDKVLVEMQKERIKYTVSGFYSTFGKKENLRVFSAPGRTEIGGNHTDHQHGRVLCGSVTLDVIAVVALNDSGVIRIKSEGYDIDTINISEFYVNEHEYNKSVALLRGTAAKFKSLGYEIKGFDAYTTSNVLKGSGLSSSAAFEVLLGNIFSSLFADNKVDAVEIAKIGQYAENEYFGKPCGLMDQMASSVGGVVTIDFENPEKPLIEKVDFTLDDYSLCIIDSCADHADLTDEYSAIPREMKSVAEYFGKNYLREVDENEFYANIKGLREKVNDRAVLRATHFFADNKRVPMQVKALKENDSETFTKLVTESGHSSFMYLQNVYASRQPYNQAVAIVLSACERLLDGKGAYRVHGGGFAGTVQAFVPKKMTDNFKKEIEKIVGSNKCHILSIRPVGGTEIR